jgi:GntR family transcriptional regulator
MPVQIVRDPIYHQLNQALRELISSADFTAGDRFLTERQVSERFQVSRATANKALSNLVAEGVLEFRKGVGTFVRGGILDYDLRRLVSFTERATAAGRTPSTRVLSFAVADGGSLEDQVRQRLGLNDDDGVYVFERLRLADRSPVIHERRCVVAGLCPDLTRSDLKGSLYTLWSGRYRLSISGAEQTIRAVAMTALEARHLGVRRGFPGLAVEAVGYVVPEQPLWWERALYRADRYEFHTRLGALETVHPAVGRFADAAGRGAERPT